ncbi:MAG: 1-acyl-sn-glycerol-3-phosphate acyltransferase [Candidatus Dormibacteraeota bacterium]|nr:1-acyl-sn-glycerol-3-phosphate acyltransferase [Candidatus Dormibacteraeota bacterium]MBV9524880.1 1-acyl-sn-glycerol-3-phosphate acyltransferase [Candidatus Dormibacteraeota bacterium]
MSGRLRGFPDPFPVRNDGHRPWRYRVVSFLSRAVLRAWFGAGLQVRGMENVPLDGPMLMVCNHLSNVDAFLFGGYAPGTMFCMAKRELYSNPATAWILGGCNCYPVDRGAPDRWALRTTLDILARRGRVLIFVEGTRAASPGMKRAEAGIGFLARRSGARLLPVAVWGTERALRRGAHLPRRVPVTVQFGEAFELAPPSGRADDRAIADEVAARIAALLPPAYRGVYG